MIELDLTPPQKMVRLLMGFISARAIYTGTKLDLADSVSGILLERAPAIEAARSGQGGPLPGCELIEGDYFEGVPSDVDIYVLKRVLFDHSDDDVVRILRNCLPAMSLNGRLHGIQNCTIPLTTNSIYGNEP